MNAARRQTVQGWKKNPTFRKGSRYYRILKMLSKHKIMSLKQLNSEDSLDLFEAVKTSLEDNYLRFLRDKGESLTRLNYYMAKAGKKKLRWPGFNPDEVYKEMPNVIYVKYPWSSGLHTQKIGPIEDKGKRASTKAGLKEARKDYKKHLKNYHDYLKDLIGKVEIGKFKYKSDYNDYNMGIALAVLEEQGYLRKPSKGIYQITAKGLKVI